MSGISTRTVGVTAAKAHSDERAHPSEARPAPVASFLEQLFSQFDQPRPLICIRASPSGGKAHQRGTAWAYRPSSRVNQTCGDL